MDSVREACGDRSHVFAGQEALELAPREVQRLPTCIKKGRRQPVLTQKVAMAMRSAMVGTRAPNFSLVCTEGPRPGRRRVSLDDYLDRWLLLLFYSRDFSLV